MQSTARKFIAEPYLTFAIEQVIPFQDERHKRSYRIQQMLQTMNDWNLYANNKHLFLNKSNSSVGLSLCKRSKRCQRVWG